MARTPKAAPPSVPAGRGRKPKTAEPIEFAAATDDVTEEAETVVAEAVSVTPIKKPARGKPGPKARPEPAMPALPEEDEQPAIDLDQPDTVLEQAPVQDDAMIAELAYPASVYDGVAPMSSDTDMDNASPVFGQNRSEQAKPAARWERDADTVQFDWPAIERTAAQDGPNQAMAKLLVAARAEGANSRWPL